MAKPLVTADELREDVIYCPESGLFRRRRTTQWFKEGDPAGCKNGRGYIIFSVRRRMYPAQRLAWLYMTGEWPNGFVDHIDGDPANNRFSNLRVVTPAQNTWNRRRCRRNSTGVIGVSFLSGRGKFAAHITVSGKRRCLGEFNTIDEAASARKLAEKQFIAPYTRRGA